MKNLYLTLAHFGGFLFAISFILLIVIGAFATLHTMWNERYDFLEDEFDPDEFWSHDE